MQTKSKKWLLKVTLLAGLVAGAVITPHQARAIEPFTVAVIASTCGSIWLAKKIAEHVPKAANAWAEASAKDIVAKGAPVMLTLAGLAAAYYYGRVKSATIAMPTVGVPSGTLGSVSAALTDYKWPFIGVSAGTAVATFMATR